MRLNLEYTNDLEAFESNLCARTRASLRELVKNAALVQFSLNSLLVDPRLLGDASNNENQQEFHCGSAALELHLIFILIPASHWVIGASRGIANQEIISSFGPWTF